MKISVYLVGGTSVEVEADSFMVDTSMRLLAMKSGNEDLVFPIENIRYWKILKKGIVQ